MDEGVRQPPEGLATGNGTGGAVPCEQGTAVAADGELAALRQAESVIDRAQRTVVTSAIEAGAALAGIRERRLYQADGYDSFDGYCRHRWDLRRESADRMIRVARAGGVITAAGLPLPRSLRAMGPLIPLTDDELIGTWRRALTMSPEPTERVVTQSRAIESAPSWDPYADCHDDPNGWLTVLERVTAKPVPTTVTIPATATECAREFGRILTEATAITAWQLHTFAAHPETWPHDDAPVHVATRMWDAGERHWPWVDPFWPLLEAHGWLDVREFVAGRLSDDDPYYERAAAVFAALAVTP